MSNWHPSWSDVPGLKEALEKGLTRVFKTGQYIPSSSKAGDRVWQFPKGINLGQEVVWPLVAINRDSVIRDFRNAIVHSEFKIRDEDRTKNGVYVSDWIALDQVALCICSLRRGGVGMVLSWRKDFAIERKDHLARLPEVEKQKMVREGALAKLTQLERIALGV